jgi:hypothetical protein
MSARHSVRSSRIGIIVDNLEQVVHSRFITPLRCAPDWNRPTGGSPHAKYPLRSTVSTSAPAIDPRTTRVLGETPTPDAYASPPIGGTSPAFVSPGKPSRLRRSCRHRLGNSPARRRPCSDDYPSIAMTHTRGSHWERLSVPWGGTASAIRVRKH